MISSAHVRLRTLVALAAAIVSVGLIGASAGTAKPSCPNKSEAKDCKLPKGATYHFGKPGEYESTVKQGKKKWTIDWSSYFDCSGGSLANTPGGDNYPAGGTGSRQGKLKVGNSYTFSEHGSGTNPDTGQTTTQDSGATLKIVSAKKATIKFTLTRTTDGSLDCQGGGKVTLKRTN